MLYPIKVVDIELAQSSRRNLFRRNFELSRPLATINNLDGYMGVQGLVRLHGVPIGYVKAPITNGCCTAATLSRLILEEHSQTIINRLLENGLAASPNPQGLRLEELFDVPPPKYEEETLITVAVCTRDRTSDLALCLNALCQLDYPNLDLLVIDNAPTSNATEKLVESYPHVRYVCEPRPGLDWARNRAISEAKGEIIAYTDDDVVVDTGWIKAIAQVFAQSPEVMAVTGLVVPYELETEAQVLFEMYGGFGRGFERKWYRPYPGSKMPWQWLGTGQFGTGANMAYRRCVFDKIGDFDPALDVGTVTNGGGDLEMFFRVLKSGHTLVYEPRGIVRHRHRRDYQKLRSQIANNSIGLFSYCVCSLQAYPEERLSFLKLFIWWVIYWNLRRLWISFKHPLRFPQDLIKAELIGCFVGLTRYHKARKNAAEIAHSDGSLPWNPHRAIADDSHALSRNVAVRTIEVSQPIQPLTNITDYSDVQVFVTWNREPIGDIQIANCYQSLGTSRLIEAIVNRLGIKLLKPAQSKTTFFRAEAFSILTQHYTPPQKDLLSLPAGVSVTINLATYDRPDDLRNCLRCLIAQASPRQVEIIVVDNHPASGLTPPVVADFPGVKLVSEPRQGLAYARNAGFAASTGDIVIATDDDVTMPPDWLEKLLVPFARPEVMIVTGNVLPLQLETIYQRFFERYGGLGRGFEPLAVSGDWFESFPRDAVPTWRLGATANAAFRASLFSHPQIGLMDEALGPGMPSGVGEDTYLFYKALKASYTLVYEPAAYVWHKHRRDLSALRRQIYGYSKGHVSYNLTTWLRDGDWRGLWRVLIILPLVHLRRIMIWLKGQSDYPLSLILLEIRGNLAGPWSLWQSRRRVKREGRSAPYLSSQRQEVDKHNEKTSLAVNH